VGVRIHPGLPGSSTLEIEETGRRVLELEPDFVRVYPVLVLAGSWLEEMMEAGQYRPLTLDEAVAACKSLLAMCHDAGVPVARMGLQPAVDLPNGGRVVAGPYHPSLRSLVDAAFMYDRANDLLTRGFRFAREVVLWVSPKDEASLIGHEGANLRRLKERFRLREVRICTDPDLPRRTVRLEIPGTPGQLAS
jgi:histone acetyltransferase (RNA polymerase elongator complex component)